MSDESKKKISLSKKGSITWNKGKTMSESMREKMRGNTNGSGNKGRTFKKSTLLKMRQAKLGKPSGLKGKKLTKEHIKKISDSHKGKTHSNELRMINRLGQIKRYLKLNPEYELKGRNKRIVENGGFHSEEEWQNLKTKYNFICPCCKKSEPEIKLTRDHIVPLLFGGKNDLENLQPLCLKCNIKKHTKTIKY
jgi:5-methylcytosine-specific restriction endonuclease McrA